MSQAERYDVLVLGSGTGGKLVAWTLAREGSRTAVVERKMIGGSCANVACLPSKNIIHSAKVASLFRRYQEFGIQTGPIAVNTSYDENPSRCAWKRGPDRNRHFLSWRSRA